MSFPLGRNNDGLVTVVCGSSYSFRNDHPNYVQLVDAIKNEDEVKFHKFYNKEAVINNYVAENNFAGVVEVKEGEVFYNGKLVHSTLSRRIVEFQEKGLPFEPLVKFMEKLYQNPSNQSISELYEFLEHTNMPITNDGDFLAYKTVKSDYWSKTAGTLRLIKGTANEDGYIYNGIGEEIECHRGDVDDNRSNTCSTGLHFSNESYCRTSFYDDGDKTIIVKVNPKDVVSIPPDHDAQKARTCRYVVVEDYISTLPETYINESEFYSEEDEEEDEYILDDYFDEYCNDECENYEEEYDNEEYLGEPLTYPQIRKGDKVSFNYTTSKENRTRYLVVEEATKNYIFGQLLNDDPKFEAHEENYRKFLKAHISEILLLN
jgi:hypothetical protein